MKDFRSIGECDLSKENTFFSCLSFNQESSRLASVQGEIRVGGAFQVSNLFNDFLVNLLSNEYSLSEVFDSMILLVYISFVICIEHEYQYLYKFGACGGKSH